MSTQLASKRNMTHWYPRYATSLFAFSHFTDEEFSANPADYWGYPDEWVLQDAEGHDMILQHRVTYYLDPDVEKP